MQLHTVKTCGLRTPRLKFGKKGAYIKTHSAWKLKIENCSYI